MALRKKWGCLNADPLPAGRGLSQVVIELPCIECREEMMGAGKEHT